MKSAESIARRCLKFFLVSFFIYLFLEGVLRKWVLPGVPGIILYALKYLLLIIITIIYCSNRSKFAVRQTTQSRSIKEALGIYILILIFSGATMGMYYNGPIVTGITFLQYASPIILIYAIPAVIRNYRNISSIIKVFLIIAMCVLVLACVQYFSPPLSPINKYAEELKTGMAMVGNAVRISSVFSYLTPLGDFCILSGTMMLSLLLTRLNSKWSRLIVLTVLIMSVVVAFMNGGRTVVILLMASLLFILLRESIVNRRFSVMAGAIAVLFIAVYFYNSYGITAVDNFIDRANSANDTDTRISRMVDYGRMTDDAGIFGYGIGIANLSVQSMLTTRPGIDFEEEIGRVVLEFGYLGFILVSIFRFYVWLKMLLIVRCIRNRKIKMLSWATLIIITPMTFYLQLCLYNWFAYMLYFTMIGFNLALSNIDLNYSILPKNRRGNGCFFLN